MSPDAMTSGWYYAKAGAPVGHEVGPLLWQELYLLAQDGSLAPSDLVWNPKLPRGVTAARVPGLFPSLAIPEPSQTKTTPVPSPKQIPAEQPAAPTPPEAPPAETPLIPAESVEPLASRTPQAVTADLPLEPTAPSPAETESQRLSTESFGPISEDEPAVSPKKRSHTNLPWLIVLLAAAIAASGLAAYFIYLRGLWV